MPNLGDYIGQLLAEITIARMHADLEAVRVAELYVSHPLLRNMPVPRFRLPDVELDVPVVIGQMEEPPKDGSPRGGAALEDMRKAFDKVLDRELGREGIATTPEDKKNLKVALDEKLASFGQPKEISGDVNRVADELSSSVCRVLSDVKRPGKKVAPELLAKFEESLKAVARNELLGLRRPPPRLKVLVTTGEIREAGPSETITRFKLKISEQAFEWTTIESEGRKRDRLVPE